MQCNDAEDKTERKYQNNDWIDFQTGRIVRIEP